jgi:hypothetical protein
MVVSNGEHAKKCKNLRRSGFMDLFNHRDTESRERGL